MPIERLFRDEATAHQSRRLYGNIILKQPWPAAVLTALFVSLILLLLVFFFTASVNRKENLDGLILPSGGLIRTSAPEAGIIVEKRAIEGQRVAAGEVLFVLSNERSTQHGDTQGNVIHALTARITSLREELKQISQQTESKRRALERQHQALLSQQAELNEEIALQTHRTELAETTEQRYRTLAKDNHIAALQAQEKMAEALEQKLALKKLLRLSKQLRAEQEAIADQIHALPLATQREYAALERAIGDAEREVIESEARRQVLVRSPVDGVLSVVSAALGQAVSGEQSLATIHPAGSHLEAVFYAPSRAVGFVRVGTPVELRLAAFPYEKFGLFQGTVTAISSSPVMPTELPTTSAGDGRDDPLRYRVRVAIDRSISESGLSLKAGMRTEATLLIEQRKLYEWAFQPLLRISKSNAP